MKTIKALILTVFVSFLAVSCFKDNDDSLIATNSINDFVWKGMNSWYYWQTDVPNLDDTKDDNASQYQAYLDQYSSPEQLFNSLRYQYGTVDRFSWFVDNYIEQLQSFQGISEAFGIRFQPVQINANGDVIMYIEYVSSDSPAKDAGILRGDIISGIDGTSLNTSNFSTIINNLDNSTVTFSFVTVSNGTLTAAGDKTLTKRLIFDNPVVLAKVFDNIEGKKVGYLVYNGFRSAYHSELNAAFATFKSAGIDELVLDLRLNGGGSVETCSYLASMIDANAAEGVFAQLNFNAKHSNEDGAYNFTNTLNVYDADYNKTGTETINRLTTLNQLYVLTSGGTASASEMIINGLKAYMPVKLIGTTTYGKNVGSITLYDSPGSDYTDINSANAGHLNAMQPIVFKIFNKDMQSDYTLGFTPDIEVKEYEYWDNILPFGDMNEIMLKTALDDIRGYITKVAPTKMASEAQSIELAPKKFENEMYITPSFLKQ
ncbi:S41 family peptidase [Gaetbulibacter aestuarii]|uniref:S41 family peptidase n=1 Tax=Gaetbulibacter aestuarii TaxID=1502358 RepID=A0ABW7MXH5_9FLAO